MTRLPSLVDRNLSIQGINYNPFLLVHYYSSFTKLDINVLLKQLYQQKASLQSNHKDVIQWLMKKILNRIKSEKINHISETLNDLEHVKHDLIALGIDISKISFPKITINDSSGLFDGEGQVPKTPHQKRKLGVTPHLTRNSLTSRKRTLTHLKVKIKQLTSQTCSVHKL